jgi:hypothetical protein
MVVASALLVALSLAADAGAKSNSKLCSLIPRADIGRPVHETRLTIRSVSTVYPPVAGNGGKLVLCDFTGSGGVVASSSVATIRSAAGAHKELAAQVKRVRAQHGHPRKLRGRWDEAYWLGQASVIMREGRHIFTLAYASGAPGASKITPAVMSRLAAKAARKL